MKRLREYLLGPETFWVVAYLLTLALTATNQPPTVEGNQRLELIGWFWGPTAALISCATLIWLRHKWWGLLRVFSAGCVGVFLVTSALCGAMRYDDSRDSGVGTAWMMFVMLGWMTLASACVFCALLIALAISLRAKTDSAAAGATVKT